jgi:hypothetical protein
LYVLWLYLAEATNSTPLFKMCMQISIYLFHWLVHIGLRQLISSMKELFNNILSHIHGIHWIKLAPSLLTGIIRITGLLSIGISLSEVIIGISHYCKIASFSGHLITNYLHFGNILNKWTIHLHFVKLLEITPHWHFLHFTDSFIFSFLTTTFRIGLAYNHYVTYRLFVAFISINPLFLFISLCFKKVLGMNSFCSEYSLRSIFGGVC